MKKMMHCYLQSSTHILRHLGIDVTTEIDNNNDNDIITIIIVDNYNQ
jgi:hypothetical protein